MKRIPRTSRIMIASTAIVAIGFLSTASGQDLTEAAPNAVLINDLPDAHPISAAIEPSTMLVAEIDWEKIDVDAFFQFVQNLTGDRPSDARLVKQLIEQLRKGKAGKIYLLAGFQTPVDGMPLVIIPAPDPAALRVSIEELIGKCPPSVEVTINELGLVFGAKGQISRITSMAPVKRDELLMPLMDAKRLDHTAVLALPSQTRELLGSVWPSKTPASFPVGISPNQLIQGVNRVILTVRTPPNPLVRLIVDANSEQTATQFAKQFAAVKQRFGETLSNVTIRRDKGRVTLEADGEVFKQCESIAVRARANAREAELVNTLKQIGLSFYNYYDREKHFPPRCFVDPDGKPLHSWLVALLPDFNNLALYRSIRLDLPWNAEQNSRLKITTLAGIGDQSLPVAHTTIRAPVFPGSLWQGDGPPKTLADITDDRASTIFLADAPIGDSIHWADPAPWMISETNPMKDFFGDRESVRVLLGDGSVLLLKRSEMDNNKLKAMLTIAGGD